jgi:excisionase family DNA binding protein
MLDKRREFAKMSLMSNQKTTEGAKYITVKEAAARMGITGRHVRRLYKSGLIDGRRQTPAKNSRILINVDSIKDFLDLA